MTSGQQPKNGEKRFRRKHVSRSPFISDIPESVPGGNRTIDPEKVKIEMFY